MRGPAVALLACFVALLPVRAFAQAPRGGGVVFSWVRADGAESCPGRPELAAEVSRRLGYDPFRSPFGQSLEGVVSRADGGWRVALFSRDPAGVMLGQRTIESEEPDCAALAEAVALAMALAIDPEAALRAPPPEADALPPEPAPEPEPEPEPERAPQRGPAPGSEERLRLSLGAVGSLELVPGLTAGARLGVDGPILPELRWYGAVVWWSEQVATSADASFGVGLTSLSLGLCAGTQLDWFRVDGCASLDLGAAWAVVYSPTPRAPGQRLYLGASGLLRLEARLIAPVWLGVFGGVAVPFILYEYRVQGRPDVVFQPSPVAPVAGIELAVRFW